MTLSLLTSSKSSPKFLVTHDSWSMTKDDCKGYSWPGLAYR
jgi:hypothetical protein